MSDGLYDNINNLRNSFEHEMKHVRDVKEDPVAHFNRTNSEKELRAIDFQQNTPTYLKTTPEYKLKIKQYKNLFQN